MSDNFAELHTKSKLRHAIFIASTVVLLLLSNYSKTLFTLKLTEDFIYRYANVVDFSIPPRVHVMIRNLDKSFYFISSFLIWIPFVIVGLLFVKLIYHKHVLQKQIFIITLTAFLVKIVLFLILIGGSFTLKLAFPDIHIFNKLIITQFHIPRYGIGIFNSILDIIFFVTLFIGFLRIYKEQLKHFILKRLGASQ